VFPSTSVGVGKHETVFERDLNDPNG
jgi:hypothetical protein